MKPLPAGWITNQEVGLLRISILDFSLSVKPTTGCTGNLIAKPYTTTTLESQMVEKLVLELRLIRKLPPCKAVGIAERIFN